MEKIKNRLLRCFQYFFELISRKPGAIVGFGALLAVVCGIYSARTLTFLPNFAGLSNNETEYNKTFQAYNDEFYSEPAITVVAKGKDVKRNEAFLKELSRKLLTDPVIEKTVYKIDLTPFQAWAMTYLPLQTLKKITSTIKAARVLFLKMDTHPDLVSFWNAIIEMSKNPSALGASGDKGGLSQLKQIVDDMTDELQGKKITSVLGGELGGLSRFPEEEYNLTRENGKYVIYLTLDHGRYAILNAYAKKDKSGVAMLEPAVSDIRGVMQSLASQFPGVEFHLTGEPVMGVEEMEIAKHDIFVAGIISLILCSFIFVTGFMEFRKPVLSLISLFIGIGWSLGYITLTVKHLNVFTISLFPMLIGLAIDFSIQFMGRYREERMTLSPEAALLKTYLSTGTGLFTAALTTAMGFFAISFTKYTGIAELGTATGGSLLLCFFSTMTVLPALLLLTESKKEKAHESQFLTFGIRVEKFLLRHAFIVVILAGLLTLVLGYRSLSLSFDHDILNLEAKNTDSVKTELELLKVTNKSSIFAIMIAKNPEEARVKVNELQTLGTVSSIQSPLSFLPQDQENKLPVLKELQDSLHGLSLSESNAPVAVDKLEEEFVKIHGMIHQAQAQMATTGSAIGLLRMFIFPGSDLYLHTSGDSTGALAEANSALDSFHQSVIRFLKTLKETDSKRAEIALTQFQHALFGEIADDLDLIKNGIPDKLITLADLPAFVKDEFIGKTGKILIEIFPSQNIWERPALERFVSQLRGIDPNVTGAPILIFETTKEMLESYKAAAKIAFLVILIVTFIKFRSIFLTFLTLTPLGVGLLWLMGIMVLDRKSFNPANLLTLPVILGIGVAFGVYVVNRFREESQPSIFSNSTGKSVLLSALTSTAGFASLLVVNHQGLQSLGFAMTVGLVAITIQALVVLPAMIQLTIREK